MGEGRLVHDPHDHEVGRQIEAGHDEHPDCHRPGNRLLGTIDLVRGQGRELEAGISPEYQHKRLTEVTKTTFGKRCQVGESRPRMQANQSQSANYDQEQRSELGDREDVVEPASSSDPECVRGEHDQHEHDFEGYSRAPAKIWEQRYAVSCERHWEYRQREPFCQEKSPANDECGK